jgi:predicted transcriptional regulator
MTRAQVKKYIKNMKQAQKLAQEKIKSLKEAGDLEQSEEEIKKLENQIEEAFD